MTLVEMLEQTATKYPDQEAMVYKSIRLTYGSVYQSACQVSSRLVQEGALPGDRIVLLLKNSPSYFISYFAVLRAGGVVVSLNPDTTAYELDHLLSDSEPKGIICHSSVLPMLQPLIENLPVLEFILVDGCLAPGGQDTKKRVDLLANALQEPVSPHFPFVGSPENLAQIIYTSGTTARPKGVMLTHGNLMANTESIVTYLKLTERDRVMVILPFFYSYGNSLLLTHTYVGGTLVVSEQAVFLNNVVSQMVQERITGFSGVPSCYAMLLRQSVFPQTRFETLRYVTCAGGALTKPLIAELQACLPNTEIYIMYGQTEASARLSYLDPADLTKQMGSIGRGVPGVGLKVLKDDGTEVIPGEVGQIVAEGDCIMKGYWNNPTETEKVLKGGRLYTGDLATVSEDGFIYIEGRRSDIIKCGSYRIQPMEIEEILNACPGVVESAVVGISDEVLGESIVAFVVISSHSSCSSSELLHFTRRFLPTYKLPKKVVFLEQLPKTSSQKIKRAALRQQGFVSP